VTIDYSALSGYPAPFAPPTPPAAYRPVQIGAVTIDYSVLQY
jgi:hypothetical protein